MNRSIKKVDTGLSLLEILVVITLFSVLAILTTRAILLTLRGSKKSESTARVRENIDYSLAVIERNLRNAESITDCSDPQHNLISYLDENGNETSFSWTTDVDGGFIASGSGVVRLTSSEVNVAECDFICDETTSPPSVEISIEARDASVTGLESGRISVSTKIYLRSY